MSADSIELNSSNEIFKKPTTLHQYGPIKNLINKQNTLKTSIIEIGNTDVKDLLSVLPATIKKQGRIVKIIFCLFFFELNFLKYRLEEMI